MKSILFYIVAVTVVMFTLVAAKPAAAIELRECLVSSVRSTEVGKGQNKQTVIEMTVKTKDNHTYTIIVGPKAKFTKVINGKVKHIPHSQGVKALVQGNHIGINGKETQKGIIAVLIAL